MASHNAQTTASKTNKAKAKQPKSGTKSSTEASATVSNRVDDASDQTFPASDAPASWAGKDIAPQDREDAAKRHS